MIADNGKTGAHLQQPKVSDGIVWAQIAPAFGGADHRTARASPSGAPWSYLPCKK
jgi:hypothetical protein